MSVVSFVFVGFVVGSEAGFEIDSAAGVHPHSVMAIVNALM